MVLKNRSKLARFGAALAAALAVSACGADDIQLNGKIFDAVGMNTGSVKNADPQLRGRAPLVVPPGLQAGVLPEPGSGKAQAPNLTAEVQDHDTKRQASKSDLERQQAEYCKVHYEQPKARGDASADSAEGPLGSCRGSVFSAVSNWNKGEAQDDEQ